MIPVVLMQVVLGAFTPGCQGTHLPGFINNYAEFKQRGIDIIAVIAYDSAFVMYASHSPYSGVP